MKIHPLAAAASRQPRASAVLGVGLCLASCSAVPVQHRDVLTPPRASATLEQIALAETKLDDAAVAAAEGKKAAAYCAWEYQQRLERWRAAPFGPVPVAECWRQELKAASAMAALVELHGNLLKTGETTAPLSKYLMPIGDPTDPVIAWYESR